MLAAARDALIKLELVAAGDPLPPFWARMSDDLVLMVYVKPMLFYAVKVGIQTALDREFRGLSIANDALPDNVPRLLGLTNEQGFPVLVTAGVPHEPLLPLRDALAMEILEREIEAFLAVGPRAFARADAKISLEPLHDALRNAGTRAGWHGWPSYWTRIRGICERQPPVLQHGDLSVNNIGIRDGKLIFFDWEDFGLVELPGYDLVVLLLSLNDFDARRLAARLAEPSAESRILERSCRHLGLTVAEFLECIPLHLALFIELKPKLGYRSEVADRAVGALHGWLEHGVAQGSRA